MPYSKKTVCILGGGFAGLAAAVFLDNLGFKITLYEKKPVLGGRAYSFLDRKTNTWVDNGQHLLMGAYHETLKFLETIGASHHLTFQKKTNVPLITHRKVFSPFRLPSLKPPFNVLYALGRMKAFTFSEKIKFLKVGWALNALQHNLKDPSLNCSVETWLDSLRQTQNAKKNFWDMVTLATLNDDPKVAGARALATVLCKGFFGSKEDGVLVLPCSPLNDLLAKPAQSYLQMRGQQTHTNCGAKKIHILDNRIQGIELESGEIVKADYYLSAVPFRALLPLIPEGFLKTLPYFKNLKTLKSAPILSINLWYDRDIFDHSFVGVAEKKIHWYFNRNRLTDTTHPPYHYMGVTSGAYDLVNSSKEEILNLALEELRDLFPEAKKAKLLHSLVNKEREATLSPTFESENDRPTQQSPFENFFVIGDWTNTGLPATIESAVLSARLATDQIHRRSAPPVARSHSLT